MERTNGRGFLKASLELCRGLFLLYVSLTTDVWNYSLGSCFFAEVLSNEEIFFPMSQRRRGIPGKVVEYNYNCGCLHWLQICYRERETKRERDRSRSGFRRACVKKKRKELKIPFLLCINAHFKQTQIYKQNDSEYIYDKNKCNTSLSPVGMEWKNEISGFDCFFISCLKLWSWEIITK